MIRIGGKYFAYKELGSIIITFVFFRVISRLGRYISVGLVSGLRTKRYDTIQDSIVGLEMKMEPIQYISLVIRDRAPYRPSFKLDHQYLDLELGS